MPSDREGPVAGILLAAGTSSRMGSNKLLFELDGESVLRRAAKRALAGGLSPLLVVLGHESNKAARELDGLPCQWALNPLYEQGINSSLKSGIMAVHDRSLFNKLLMMTGEGCGRQVVKRHRGEAEVLPWPVSALADIDVPEDYAWWVRSEQGGS